MHIKRISPNETEVVVNERLVDREKHARFFFSYDTIVAAKVGTKYYKTEEKFSQSTSRHLNKWLETEGDHASAEAQIKPQTWFEKLLFDVDNLSDPYMALR